MPQMRNFGRNIRFTPAAYYRPENEEELLSILERHAAGRIRVVGARHSWSGVCVSEDAVVDMGRFDRIEVKRQGNQTYVTVGAGCQIKHILALLARRGLTLPAVGLIAEQTIAGAIATGTHGSGRHSLSHYVSRVRLASYRAAAATARVDDVSDGDALLAARCSLGCLGVVVSVEIPCVPQYRVVEQARFCVTADEACASEAASPLQQFFLLPHQWRYCVQMRAETTLPRSLFALLYRLYWFLGMDLGLHLLIKLFAAVLRSRTLVSALYRHLLPWAIFPTWKVIDRSDRMLLMKHDLFRHMELEAFVPRERLAEAARLVEAVLRQADGSLESMSDELAEHLDAAGLAQEFDALRGTFSHHYPVCFRRILRDDTLLSMASGEPAWWYSISLITYVHPREDFFRMAELLARLLVVRLNGRIHWGKWFPLGSREIDQMYPDVARFRAVCREFDPHGVFQNAFTQQILRGPCDDTPRKTVADTYEIHQSM